MGVLELLKTAGPVDSGPGVPVRFGKAVFPREAQTSTPRLVRTDLGGAGGTGGFQAPETRAARSYSQIGMEGQAERHRANTASSDAAALPIGDTGPKAFKPGAFGPEKAPSKARAPVQTKSMADRMVAGEIPFKVSSRPEGGGWWEREQKAMGKKAPVGPIASLAQQGEQRRPPASRPQGGGEAFTSTAPTPSDNAPAQSVQTESAPTFTPSPSMERAPRNTSNMASSLGAGPARSNVSINVGGGWGRPYGRPQGGFSVGGPGFHMGMGYGGGYGRSYPGHTPGGVTAWGMGTGGYVPPHGYPGGGYGHSHPTTSRLRERYPQYAQGWR